MNAGSWALGPEGQAAEVFLTALNLMTGDAESARTEARRYGALEQWRKELQLRVGGTSFGVSLIPGLQGGGIVLELPYLLRLMGRGAIGTGELMNAKIEPDADLLAIFALWSGTISTGALAAAVGGVVIVDGIGYPQYGAKALAIGFKLVFKTVASHPGISVVAGTAIGHAAGPASQMLQPISAKVLAKVSAKLTAKFGAKAVAGFLPFLGACVSTGISLYILNEFLTAARIYYEYKVEDSGGP